jgi:hypothetical protein
MPSLAVRTDTEARQQQAFFPADRSATPYVRPIHSIDHEHHPTKSSTSAPGSNLVAGELGSRLRRSSCCSTNARGIANVGLCRERPRLRGELAGRYTQVKPLLPTTPSSRADIAMLEAETRAGDRTNWRFLLTERAEAPAGLRVGTQAQGHRVAAGDQRASRTHRRPGRSGAPLRRRSHARSDCAALFYSRAASIYGGTTEVQKDILAAIADKANMNFELNEDQAALAESLSRLLADRYGFEKRRALTASGAAHDEKTWAGLAELGLTALPVPEAPAASVAVRATCCPRCRPSAARSMEPFLASAVLAGTALRLGADEAMQTRLLPGMASGDRVGRAHDEPAGRHAPLWWRRVPNARTAAGSSTASSPTCPPEVWRGTSS